MYGGTVRECKVRACRRLAGWVEIDKPRCIILYTYICPRQGVPKCVSVIYGAQYDNITTILGKERVREREREIESI